VQAGTATAQPKAGDGPIEMLRVLQAAHRSAVKARTQAANQLHALVVTVPDSLRTRLRGLSRPRLVATATTFRPRLPLTSTMTATQLALKSLAVRYEQLTAEIEALEAQLELLVAKAAPDLVAVKGIGTDIATTLLTTAGDNPDRLRSEGAFAHLCGVAPIPALPFPPPPPANQSPPPQPGWRPRRQPGTVPACCWADGLGSGDASLRRAPHHRGPIEERDPPVLEAVHRPKALSAAGPESSPAHGRVDLPGCEASSAEPRLQAAFATTARPVKRRWFS